MITACILAPEMRWHASRFVERMAGFSKARNVLTGENPSSLSALQLPAETAVVLALLKQLLCFRTANQVL